VIINLGRPGRDRARPCPRDFRQGPQSRRPGVRRQRAATGRAGRFADDLQSPRSCELRVGDAGRAQYPNAGSGNDPLSQEAARSAADPAWLLALLRAPGIGPARSARLLEHFGSAAAALAADRAEWAQLGMPAAALDALRTPDWRRVEQDLAWLERPGNHLLPCE
jgi:hypothetical protein